MAIPSFVVGSMLVDASTATALAIGGSFQHQDIELGHIGPSHSPTIASFMKMQVAHK